MPVSSVLKEHWLSWIPKHGANLCRYEFQCNYEHLIVGSHPRDANDIRVLYYQNRVRAIVNLQRSEEPLRGNIDEITERCALLGDRIWYQRVPVSVLQNSLQHFQIKLHR